MKTKTEDTNTVDKKLAEAANMGNWLEARMHTLFTEIVDGLYGDGRLSKEEQAALHEAFDKALEALRGELESKAPQIFERSPWVDAPEGLSEGNGLGEGGDLILEEGKATPLVEKAISNEGIAKIKLISPGWGSSGYYPAEVLARDGAKAFPAGTKMFWNHPTLSEESERPERDLNSLASVLVSDAEYFSNHAAGPGLYANAKVFEGYKAAVDEMADYIGTSIRAHGRATQGSVDGRKGAIITEIAASDFNTVDYVTVPGAGGEVLTMFEAARNDRIKEATNGVAPIQPLKEEEVMDELQKLQQANATLQSQLDEAKAKNARFAEALAMRDARDLTRAALDAATLPDVTKARMLEALSKNPVIKDDALDIDAQKVCVEEAIKAEIEYLGKLMGKGDIRLLGEGYLGPDEDEDAQKKLEEAFMVLGLSESGAKTAARGRK